MIVRLLLIIFTCLFMTSCWSSEEIDQTAIVHGVGVDKLDDQLEMSVEIVKPIGDGQNDNGDGDNIGNQLVLNIQADTFLQGARELIKYTKRRLNFSQVQAWVIGQSLAKDGFVQSLDIVRRDQMVRLNSFMFITKDNPTDILNTSTLYEDLVATELSSSVEQSNFTAEFSPITFHEFYKFIEGPVPNAFVPLIFLKEVNNQLITEVEGTAVIKQGVMVGELSRRETSGLNMLLNRVNGGNIQINLSEDEKVSLEISKLKTKIKPVLKGEELFVTANINVEGILADNMTKRTVNEQFLKEVKTKLSAHTEDMVHSTLKKLQDDFKTDIVQFGLKAYRKYPNEWKEVQSNWDDIFANASIDVHVDMTINHKGLINENVSRNKKVHKNPYNLKWNKESK